MIRFLVSYFVQNGVFHYKCRYCIDLKSTLFFIVGNTSNPGHAVLRQEDTALAEMEELKKLHGDRLLPYKYRLWAEMIVGLHLTHTIIVLYFIACMHFSYSLTYLIVQPGLF